MKFVAAVLALVFLQPTSTATDAWALISGADVTVFATLNNPSMYDVYVVSGKSDAAETVTLMEGDKSVTSITVPAYGSIELKPGAQRIRLSGVKGQLKAGDELKLTLETDGGAGIPVAAIVKATN